MRWVLMAICCVASGQDYGSVRGTVADPTGAIIANVPVTLRLAGGRTAAEANTTDTGTFQLNGVKPGEYKLLIRMPGFLEKLIPVRVRAGETMQ